MLTRFEIDSAEIKEKDYFLMDGDGLYLRVYPSGSKCWIVRMTVSGKSIQKSFGSYPEISIAEARRLKNKIKEEAHLPPSRLTLRQIADKWLHEYSEVSAKSSLYNHKLYVSYLAPLLEREIGSITRKDLVDQLRNVQKKHSYDTARRVAVAVGQIYQHAVNAGLLESSPAGTLSSALIRSEEDEEGHFTAILSEEGIGVLLRSLDTIKNDTVRRALQFISYTFPRSGELRKAQWKEISFENALWTIPAAHTKRRKQHIIPLSRQAIGILKEQYNLSCKGYVFPSERTGGQMGGSTLITTMYSLRKLPDGIRPEEMTVHGFRAIASTLLNASGLWRPDAIERQLSHAPEDKIREAYNRGDYMEERVRMMQWYTDKIDDLYANDMI